MNYILFGEILKDARIESNRTQAEVAQLLGVTAQNVSSWERGKSKIDIETYVKICSIYCIDTISPLERTCDSLLIYSFPMISEKSKDEHQLLHHYDLLNEKGKEYIASQLDFALSQSKYLRGEAHIPNFEQISQEAQMAKKTMDSTAPLKK